MSFKWRIPALLGICFTYFFMVTAVYAQPEITSYSKIMQDLTSSDIQVLLLLTDVLSKQKHLTSSDASRISVAVVVASRYHKVPVSLILAVIQKESTYRMHAVSSAQCRGLMQISSSIWTRYRNKYRPPGSKVTVYNPIINVLVGTAYLSDLIKNYNGDIPRALGNYFAGPAKASKPYSKRYAARVLKLQATWAEVLK